MSDHEPDGIADEEAPTLTESESALLRAMLEKSNTIGADQGNRLERDILELLRMQTLGNF
jgi:hypothetical protein